MPLDRLINILKGLIKVGSNEQISNHEFFNFFFLKSGPALKQQHQNVRIFCEQSMQTMDGFKNSKNVVSAQSQTFVPFQHK